MKGRKSLAEEWITEDGLLLLEGFARDGMTDKDIAQTKIGVAEVTFTRWKERYPTILNALKKGRAPVAEKIEKSLYDLCQVQTYVDIVEEITEHPDGTQTKHKRKTTRQVPPNPTAIIFALRNLKRHRWSNNPEALTTPDEVGDDGFIDALNGTAEADWEEDDEESGDVSL